MPRTLLRRHDKYKARAGVLERRRRREVLTAIIVIIVLMGGDIAARRPRYKAGHSLRACRRHHAITVALLLDPRERREREVIALDRQLFGHQHVIDLSAGAGGPAPPPTVGTVAAPVRAQPSRLGLSARRPPRRAAPALQPAAPS